MLWIFRLWSTQPARLLLSSHFIFSSSHLFFSSSSSSSPSSLCLSHLFALPKEKGEIFHFPFCLSLSLLFCLSLWDESVFITLLDNQCDNVFTCLCHSALPAASALKKAFQQVVEKYKKLFFSQAHLWWNFFSIPAGHCQWSVVILGLWKTATVAAGT